MDVEAGKIKAKYSVLIAASKVPATRISLGLQRDADVIASNKTFQSQIDTLKQLQDVVNGSTSSLAGLADKQELLNEIAAAFPPIVDDATDPLDSTAAAADKAAGSTEDLASQLKDASQAFSDMVSVMSDAVDQSTAIYDAFDKLGKGIADNGTDFSQYTEGGRDNLNNLLSLVDAYSKSLTTAISNGAISAQDAAATMQEYMQNLVEQLSSVGVPTDQIDFLVSYLNSVVQQNWQVSVGADISGAVSGLNQISAYLAALDRSAPGLIINGDTATMVDTSSAAGIAAISTPGAVSTGNSSVYQKYAAPPQYTGPTSFANNQSNQNNVLKSALASEKAANAAKAASAAEKDASKGG